MNLNILDDKEFMESSTFESSARIKIVHSYNVVSFVWMFFFGCKF